MTQLTAQQIYTQLLNSGIYNATGKISITLNDLEYIIKTRDAVGNLLQEWFGEWMQKNDIFYRRPSNTQEYPDFYLCEDNIHNLLEFKTYYGVKGPGFDIANFTSFWTSLETNPWRLDADYLIFSYLIDDGIISIKEVFLKKVWEITGPSKEYPLKSQIKKRAIYNIRPVSFHSKRENIIKPFSSKEEFLVALKEMVKIFTHDSANTNRWFNNVINNYEDFSNTSIRHEVEKLL